MAEEQQIPDWITSLSERQLGEEPPSEEGSQEATVESLLESLQGQTTKPDMVGDLREQMVLPEDDLDYGEKPEPRGLLPGMKPWQGFVLALLLLLNVAVLGCMVLVVTGKIMPF